MNNILMKIWKLWAALKTSFPFSNHSRHHNNRSRWIVNVSEIVKNDIKQKLKNYIWKYIAIVDFTIGSIIYNPLH